MSSRLPPLCLVRSHRKAAFACLFSTLGPVSRKSRKLFGPEKPFVKLRPAYSVKLVFSYLVKRIKTKLTAKFRASRRFRFEDTKRLMSSEMRPKSFGTYEKQAPGSLSFTRKFSSCKQKRIVLPISLNPWNTSVLRYEYCMIGSRLAW